MSSLVASLFRRLGVQPNINILKFYLLRRPGRSGAEIRGLLAFQLGAVLANFGVDPGQVLRTFRDDAVDLRSSR